MSVKIALLESLCRPVVEGLGYVFWGLEYTSQNRYSTVRIYIDSEQGILVDDCAAVSRQISSLFDVEDPIPEEYGLEVSSPGVDRPLFTLAHFEQFAGQQVKIKLRTPFEGRRNFFGVLGGIEGEDIVLVSDEHEYLLPIESIDKTNVVAQFERSEK